MAMPFDQSAFLEVFRRYNDAVWPAQLLLQLLGVAAVWMVATREGSDRLVSLILAWLWIWMAGAYHVAMFSALSSVAYVFAIAFTAEAIVLAHDGVLRKQLRFGVPHGRARRIAGLSLIVYAMVIYPAIGLVAGHAPPAGPTFGVPCPTTIFTFGLLLWTRDDPPLRVLVVPTLWSILGLSAALQLGIVEDVGLPVAALIALALLVHDRRERRHARLLPTIPR